MSRDPTTVLFACVENAGRSQMAAALFERRADPSRARAISAGTRPADRVHPTVVDAMGELGIDLGGRTPRRLDETVAREAALLITMGCGEECPLVPGARVEEWSIDDPKDASPERVRQIRDAIDRRVRDLVSREGWAR